MKSGRVVAIVLMVVGVGVILGLFALSHSSGSLFGTPVPSSIAGLTPSAVSPSASPTSVPTPAPPKEFAICQAQEPDTLFLYANPSPVFSPASLNVLEAIYDGPIDARAYQFYPVILDKLPSLADGDAAVRTVQVGEGDRVVDASGLVVDLVPGVAVFDPQGQAIVFQGETITMTQLVVTFTLRAGITWQDGQPLTADDSRYAFELIGGMQGPPQPWAWLYEQTASYDTRGERSVTWTGLPGYRDVASFYGYPVQNFYFHNFFPPLPRHFWGATTGQQMLDSEVARRTPLGWGPFVIEEWLGGDRITLVRNPRYFRAAEGLPRLDRITFRFVTDLQQALDLFAAGECDLIAQDVIENEDITPLLVAAESGQLQLLTPLSSEWEHLDFGIEPAPWVERADFFGDVRVRQAIAQCVDRERIAREAFPYGEAVTAAHSYVSPEHPLYAAEQLADWDHNPAAGRLLLDEVGWRDEDGDGVREAHGVAGVRNNTPFTVTLVTTSDDRPYVQAARGRAAQLLSEDLLACGVGVSVQFLPFEDLAADGPDGPVFGRQFDLALFSWMNDLDPPCGFYLSAYIPDPQNWWNAPTNDPGYASAEYDTACQSALGAFPGTDAYVRFHLEAQRIFSQDMPVLPLYFVPRLAAVRSDVTGVILDPILYQGWWNIEAFDLNR